MNNIVKFIIAFSLSLPLIGCGGGEELANLIGGAVGDDGKRIKLTGYVTGEMRLICVDNPPKDPPAKLQKEIDKYLFGAIDWEINPETEQKTVHKQIEDGRSCYYKIDPHFILSWDEFVKAGIENRRLTKWEPILN